MSFLSVQTSVSNEFTTLFLPIILHLRSSGGRLNNRHFSHRRYRDVVMLPGAARTRAGQQPVPCLRHLSATVLRRTRPAAGYSQEGSVATCLHFHMQSICFTSSRTPNFLCLYVHVSFFLSFFLSFFVIHVYTMAFCKTFS